MTSKQTKRPPAWLAINLCALVLSGCWQLSAAEDELLHALDYSRCGRRADDEWRDDPNIEDESWPAFGRLAGWRNISDLPSAFEHDSERMSGGYIALKGHWPWFAKIITRADGDKLVCGGALIHHNLVLTAAHCLLRSSGEESAPRSMDDIAISLGISNTDESYVVQEEILADPWEIRYTHCL